MMMSGELVLDPRPDGVRTGKVDLGKIDTDQLAHGCQRPAELPADLPDFAEQEDSRWSHGTGVETGVRCWIQGLP